MSGDLWAGAEVATYHLIRALLAMPDTEVSAFLLNPGRLSDELRKLGVRVTVANEATTSTIRLIPEIYRKVAAQQVDVIHTHRYKEHAIAQLVAAGLRVAHLRTAHGLGPRLGVTNWKSGSIALIDRLIGYLVGAKWIAVSQELASHLRGFNRDIYVVPNGIPDHRIHTSKDRLCGLFDGDSMAFHVGFVGRLESAKRPDRFLRVFGRIPERLSGRLVHGLVVGTGSLLPQLQDLAQQLRIDRRVLFAGHRDDAEQILASLDVLVIPSDHEGHPMALLEAMRARVPVVACSVGGIPEALGDTRYSVPPDQEVRLAEAVEALLRNESERREWGEALRRRYLASYTVDLTATMMMQIYLNLVRSR